jgi:C1A family cysteine protease
MTLLSDAALSQQPNTGTETDKSWTEFTTKFHKDYKNFSSTTYRRKVWESNVNFIKAHNTLAERGEVSYTLALNEYSDLTTDELKQQLFGLRVPRDVKPGSNSHSDDNSMTSQRSRRKRQSSLPASVDWRTRGYVTGVKRQGSCGACYAFAAVGALEGQNFKKTGQLQTLSEQNIIDCSTSYGNQGCNGGWMNYAFSYVAGNGGIDKSAYYPYIGYASRCRYSPSSAGAQCTGYKTVASNEASLLSAVATVGPVAAAIDASRPTFLSYSGGVYNDATCSKNVNHAVLVVGYGNQYGQDYWILKNSWGSSWGTGGYMLLARNKNNLCGVASYVSYPTV